jgi:hypothetical protein
MSSGDVASNDAADQGLRHIETGSWVGLGAGTAALALPVAVVLLATYRPETPFLRGAQLIDVTAVFALIGAILFAVSLYVYQIGFSALRPFDRRFWAASILSLCGTAGAILVIVTIALALYSSSAIADCIQGAPTQALVCLHTAAPIASYSGAVGFWLVWLGGLGIVVGVGLAGTRYREPWLFGGATLYGFLLLGLLAPAVGLLFPLGSLTYPILAAPVFGLVAPALIFEGSNRALRDIRMQRQPRPSDAPVESTQPPEEIVLASSGTEPTESSSKTTDVIEATSPDRVAPENVPDREEGEPDPTDSRARPEALG